MFSTLTCESFGRPEFANEALQFSGYCSLETGGNKGLVTSYSHLSILFKLGEPPIRSSQIMFAMAERE
jgi:hypothetical protein